MSNCKPFHPWRGESRDGQARDEDDEEEERQEGKEG
jgi:hypothetical protein